MRNREIPHVHVCRKGDVENEAIMHEPKEWPMEKGETRIGAVQPTKQQTTRDELPKIEKLTDKHTKDQYCRKATRQVRMSESKCHVDYGRIPVRASKMDF